MTVCEKKKSIGERVMVWQSSAGWCSTEPGKPESVQSTLLCAVLLCWPRPTLLLVLGRGQMLRKKLLSLVGLLLVSPLD